MTLRRAIKQSRAIVAECPHDGTCSRMQTIGGILWFSCPSYSGMVEDDDGLKVRCSMEETRAARHRRT